MFHRQSVNFTHEDAPDSDRVPLNKASTKIMKANLTVIP